MQGLIIKYLLGILLSGGLVFGGWAFYTTTKNKIETLETQNEQIASINKTNNETINKLRADVADYKEQVKQLNRSFERAEVYQNELIAKLQRHDLTRLALQKPGLIETRVNNATQELFEDLEAITTRSTD